MLIIPNFEKEMVAVREIPKEDLEFMLKEIENEYNQIDNHPSFQYVGAGSYGNVYRYKNYAIKTYFEVGEVDGLILSKIQHLSSFPNLYVFHAEFMIMEFISGVDFSDLEYKLEPVTLKDDWMEKLEQDLEQCAQLHILPQDLMNDNAIINVETGYVTIVDVGNFILDFATGTLSIAKENYSKNKRDNVGNLFHELDSYKYHYEKHKKWFDSQS